MSGLRSMNTSPTRPSPLRNELELRPDDEDSTSTFAELEGRRGRQPQQQDKRTDRYKVGDSDGELEYEGLEEALGSAMKNRDGGRKSPPSSIISVGSQRFGFDNGRLSTAPTAPNSFQPKNFVFDDKENIGITPTKGHSRMLSQGSSSGLVDRYGLRGGVTGVWTFAKVANRMNRTSVPSSFFAEHTDNGFPSYGSNNEVPDLSKAVDAALFSFNPIPMPAAFGAFSLDAPAEIVCQYRPLQRVEISPTPLLPTFLPKPPTPPPPLDPATIAHNISSPPASTISNFDIPSSSIIPSLPTISEKRFLNCRLLNCTLTRVLSVVSPTTTNEIMSNEGNGDIDYENLEIDGYNIVDCELLCCSRANTPGNKMGLPELGVEYVGGGMEYIDRA